MSGILFLTAIVACLFVVLGSALFKVKEEEQTDVFWLTGTWVMVGAAGCFGFFGRALLILVHIIDPGAAPPGYLKWIFDENLIQWLIDLGG